MMNALFEELGIPPKYLKKTIKEDRYIGLVHKRWLISLFKHFQLIDFIEHPRLEAWHTEEEPESQWIKIFISLFKKKDHQVTPLPKVRPYNSSNEHPLLFAQLVQYVSLSNYKNLWREAHKKYDDNSDSIREIKVTLTSYNDALKEALIRIYGCPIINTMDPSLSVNSSEQYNVHLNVLPAFCGVETLNAIFLLHIPYIEHNLSDCVTFSPAILDKSYSKPLFIVNQLIHLLLSLHDRSLTLGDITLNDIYLTEDLWIYVFPQISSNLFVQLYEDNEKYSVARDCRKFGHTFNLTATKCEFCGLKFYDKVQVTNEGLDELCELWIDRKISNFTYISALNKFSGRKLGDPNCHYVFPWVTDFASKCGKNWRDLKKSKYRLNKGDRQLDLTYEDFENQVPHHVSDVLSPITYYVYMARRTSKSILCKNVRTKWVPAEYPSSIQRMQEWTPDECIPEFFSDPSVFRSIHDDLEDLDVPTWASGPEDFIQKHREALESDHVSERLHHWIDLTFGYKLDGTAAVKAKNVCLHLVDDHCFLTKSGLVQLFAQPHPSRAIINHYKKVPPRLYSNKMPKERPTYKMDYEEEGIDINTSGGSNRTSLGVSKILSRSRSSLHEETATGKPSRSPSATRSTSLGPKSATFSSHVSNKQGSLNTGIISLPRNFKPESALESLEKRYIFLSKCFQVECGSTNKFTKADDELRTEQYSEDSEVQNAFTNFIYSENFEEKFRGKTQTTKSHTFPMDNFHLEDFQKVTIEQKQSNSESNYSEIISKRRMRELQVLGCLIVEIFLAKHMRALGSNCVNLSFPQRLKSCRTIVQNYQHDLPPCISGTVNLLLQPQFKDLKKITYPTISDKGLPPPSAYLFLEPLINLLIPFPKSFLTVYKIIMSLKEFKNCALELDVLYHFDCDGSRCQEYENLERTKILLAQNIAECKVKTCVKQLEIFFKFTDFNTDTESLNLLLPHIKELIEDHPTSVLAAWYLFDPISKACGPKKSVETLLQSILKLYEQEPSENYLPYNRKIAKIYHHSFLLRLIVRLGLKCFLENFVTPLVEAVGGYKDFDKSESPFHNHVEKTALKRTSHLKNMDDNNEFSFLESDIHSTDTMVDKMEEFNQEDQEEIFKLDEEKESENQMKSLIERLQLNIAADLPFNVSTAEEALDATLSESISSRGLNSEEINVNSKEDTEEQSESLSSATIPIPIKGHNDVMNISCEIGSKKSETDCFLDKKSFSSQSELYVESPNSTTIESTIPIENKKSTKKGTRISELSADSIIWLAHRLGPVLMARYLSRNLLKMLTLCYVGKENLVLMNKVLEDNSSELSIASSKVIGDENASNVLECLASITALYGEKLILFQFLPHMTELLALCKRKLTQTLEGGLISCLALLKYIIPYLSDGTLMDQLQDILSGIIHPTVRLLGSTKYSFPTGSIARNVLARKYLDALYVLSIRIGSDMTRKYLTVPALQRFFYIFDKSDFVPQIDKSIIDINIGGKPIPVHLRLKSSDSGDSLSPTREPPVDVEYVQLRALEELKQVFTAELAYVAYIPFLKHVGANCLELSLKNFQKIRDLCQMYEQQQILKAKQLQLKLDSCPNKPLASSSSFGSNISLIGNRIDIQEENSSECSVTDLLSLVSNKMENCTRHLKGNWFSYWAHEVGRPEKDTSFHFNQIKLQSFVGHSNSISSLYVLDNENSFMSSSRDKTVKLWSLRSQGDGSCTSACQWTYSAHKKSVLSLTFVDSLRLVASCDSVVHLWDPFMGAVVGQLDSQKYCPVNVVKSMPSPCNLIFSATTEGTIKVIDARICKYVYDLKLTLNPSGLIRCLAIGPDGTWIAAGQSSGNITVLDTRTGLSLSTCRAHESEVLQIVAVDNETIVSSGLDQNVNVWNIYDGKLRHHMRGATEPAHCLQVYEGQELISGTTANRIGVHSDVSPEASYNCTKLRTDTFKGLMTAMGVLPLNRLLLLGSDNGQISLLC